MKIIQIARILAVFALGKIEAAEPVVPQPATSNDFIVREWHYNDGLPHEDVFQIQQDKSGYLWISARGALSRFDGISFHSLKIHESAQTFTGMGEDIDGSTIFTSRTGDPVRYRNGIFSNEPLPSPYTGQSIGYFLIAPDGAYWFSLRTGVLRVHGTQINFFAIKSNAAEQGWARFATDGTGRVWFSGAGAVYRFESGEMAIVTFKDTLDDVRVYSSRQGGPWLVTSKSVFKLNAADEAVPITGLPQLLGSRYINDACEDDEGRLWIASRSLGIHIASVDRLEHVVTSSETIYDITKDRDGTIWAGSNSGGLAAITPKFYTLYNKSYGLTALAIPSICEDRDGHVWVANGDGGLAKISESGIQTWLLNHNSETYGVRSVSAHPEGGVWAVGGTDVFRINNSKESSFVSQVAEKNTHPNSFTAKDGTLWLATVDHRVARLKHDRYEIFGPEAGVPAEGIRAFFEADTGDLIIGTNDGDVMKFEEDRFISMFSKGKKIESAINAITAINNRLWLGTASRGLSFNSNDGLRYLGLENGLPDDKITQLVKDDLGNLWCGSARGIFRLRLADLNRFADGEINTVSAFVLGEDEGLKMISCQANFGPAAFKARDGRIWFATRQGVLAIDPSARTLEPTSPRATITEVRDDVSSFLRNGAVSVSPDARKVEIHYSTLSLAAPNRVKTRFRLLGFDSEWVAGNMTQIAKYPKLPPGSYVFELRTGFDGSSNAESVDSIKIIVPRQWWQSIWFQIIIFILIASSLTIVVRFLSHRVLLRRIETLKRESAIAHERTRIAQNIHDDVGASLTRIILLTQTNANKSHEAVNMNRIYETAAEITRSLDEIVWAINPADDTLESFVSYLTEFSQKFLATARIRCRLSIPPELPVAILSSEIRHNLFLCCREVLNNAVKHSGANEISVGLTVVQNQLTLVISDNGHGTADVDSALPSTSNRISSGHGVQNIRSRMQRINGSVAIESSTIRGTEVTFSVGISRTNPAKT